MEEINLILAYKNGAISKKLALEIAEEKGFNLIIDDKSSYNKDYTHKED